MLRYDFPRKFNTNQHGARDSRFIIDIIPSEVQTRISLFVLKILIQLSVIPLEQIVLVVDWLGLDLTLWPIINLQALFG